MRHGYFIALVEILGFFHTACSGSGNNSENASSSSSSNTTILNNMLAREILQRQALENRVATLERQITVLISDTMDSQRACSALQRDVQGISLKQNNVASSLQTITQRVDSENVNMRESLRNLSDITSKLLSKDSQCKYTYSSLYHFHPIFVFSKISLLKSSPFCVSKKSTIYSCVTFSVWNPHSISSQNHWQITWPHSNRENTQVWFRWIQLRPRIWCQLRNIPSSDGWIVQLPDYRLHIVRNFWRFYLKKWCPRGVPVCEGDSLPSIWLCLSNTESKSWWPDMAGQNRPREV